MCVIGVGIVLFLALICSLFLYGASSIKEKKRYSEPKVIAKYEPKPYYATKKKNDKDWERVREKSEFTVVERITP